MKASTRLDTAETVNAVVACPGKVWTKTMGYLIQ